MIKLLLVVGLLMFATAEAKPVKPAPDRNTAILNDLMDQVIGACYYETYQLNDTQTPSTGDVCDKAIMFYKQLCKLVNFEACSGDYFHKYLAGMGE